MDKKTLFWITIFAVSMGYFESAIVIYLREIDYPDGFDFPLQLMNKTLVLTEMIREVLSLVMLLSVSILTGKKAMTRFAWFIYSFGVWDIFFYLFLKTLTGWPESFMTQDLLFLLPVMWVGPVIAPLILSLIMIIFALSILYFSSVHEDVRLKTREILILLVGAAVVIISFTADYTGFILSRSSSEGILTLTSEKLSELSLQYVPGEFHRTVFVIGIIFILTGIGLFTRRYVQDQDQ